MLEPMSAFEVHVKGIDTMPLTDEMASLRPV